jgi:serine/threonine-protein kinase
MKRLLLVVLGAALVCGARGFAADAWQTYINDRYGTTIDYPASFQPQPPPDDDDGRAFKSPDGASFSVAASYGGIDSDLATYREFILEHEPKSAAVTYQAQGKDWFVVSGTNGDRVFYERHLLSHGGEMTEDFVMSYPAARKQAYDPIVARMAKSFRSGSGFQTQ